MMKKCRKVSEGEKEALMGFRRVSGFLISRLGSLVIQPKGFAAHLLRLSQWEEAWDATDVQSIDRCVV